MKREEKERQEIKKIRKVSFPVRNLIVVNMALSMIFL